MTRKLKEIEHGKTKDPKNAKLDSKATKLTEELKLLKVRSIRKLSPHFTNKIIFQDAKKLDMVKQVFLFSGDHEKVLKLQKTTPEQRAICRLLMNPFLKEAITAAKTKLDIKDDEDEWKEMLMKKGKNKIKKQIKEKKEKAAGIDPTTALEKKIAAKIAKNKAKKLAKKGGDKAAEAAKLKALDEKSIAIDQEARRERFEEKRREKGYVKPKSRFRGPASDKSAPKKVSLFPVKSDAPKASKPDFQKKPAGPDRPRKSFPAKPDAAPRIEKSAEKLHPSWEAKKLKKPAISDFKGKKTTFDD